MQKKPSTQSQFEVVPKTMHGIACPSLYNEQVRCLKCVLATYV